MAQTGSYEKRNGWWLLRYREQVVVDGERKTILRNRKLATLEEYPTKRQRGRKAAGEVENPAPPDSSHRRKSFDDTPDAVKQLAREFLDSANDDQRMPEQVRDLKPRVSDVWMRDVRTYTVNGWLRDTAKNKPELTTATFQRLKSFLSGVFSIAKNMGYYDSPNPVRDADLPKAKKGTSTHAHTLAEIQLMLAVLPEPAATIVAVAAYAGLRRSEIRGLRWEEYDGVALKVTRSVWEGYVGEPKTEASADDVPIIAPLRDRLEQHRQHLAERLGRRSASGWMFESEAGTPIHLGNLINREILPTLNICAMCRETEDEHADADHEYVRDSSRPTWHGFHAFRRGLATNLSALGIPAEIIRLILRHSDVATTQRHYIKPPKDEVRKAMDKLEAHLEERAKTAKATTLPN
jgi:integrase